MQHIIHGPGNNRTERKMKYLCVGSSPHRKTLINLYKCLRIRLTAQLQSDKVSDSQILQEYSRRYCSFEVKGDIDAELGLQCREVQ